MSVNYVGGGRETNLEKNHKLEVSVVVDSESSENPARAASFSLGIGRLVLLCLIHVPYLS